MDITSVNVKLDHPKAKMPLFAHDGDAGADLFACEQVAIPAGKFKLVDTGLIIELPEWTEAQVRSRSGMALKNGIFVLNAPGTIDSKYRGRVGVILANLGDKTFTVNPGDKIAQLVIKNILDISFKLVDNISSNTDRGTGGFGSTGTK